MNLEMYVNCYFKKFVAEAAAKVAGQLAECHDEKDLLADELCEKIARASVKVADALAKELKDYWRSEGDKVTVFFDPDDTENTRIENALADITGKLADVAEKIQDIEEELERESYNQE